MRTTVVLALLISAALSLAAGQQKHSRTISRQRAAKIALAQVSHGKIESAELEKEEGKLVWSFDVRTPDDLTEVWVDAHSGEVLRSETESSESEANEQAIDRAEHIALRKIPGEVAKRDSAMHRGTRVYSFQIKTRKGETVEVDVTPAGKIVDIETLTGNEDEDDDD